jgi:diguanylate cyclase (GGDEF)-like protein/PAS domain S-box-containing protein
VVGRHDEVEIAVVGRDKGEEGAGDGPFDAIEALRASEALFRTVISGSYDVTAVIDGNGVVTWVTPNCERLLGSPPDDIVGHSCLDWVHPDNLQQMAEELCAFVAGTASSYPAPIRMRHADGSWRDVEVVAADFLDHPDIGGIAVNLRDIGERVTMERERERLIQIFAMTNDLVATYDVAGQLVYINEAARRFLGVPPETPVAEIDVHAHLTDSARAKMASEVVELIAAGRTWIGELELTDAHGTVVPMRTQLHGHRDEQGQLVHISGVMSDISERKEFERRLQHEATHDALTSLPNRTLLLDRLGNALERGRRHGGGVALLFCDLDHFKRVNDSLGHTRGDLVLAEVACRLRTQLRPGDTVARFGGDEFVILGEDCRDTDDAVVIARRVHRALEAPIVVEGSEVHVGVSIGIALAAGGRAPADPEALLRDADAAMYRAKEDGRGRYQVFAPDHRDPVVDRLGLAEALRRAVTRGELDLVYQPVVRLGPLTSGDATEAPVVGVEALVRWDHPGRGRLLPGQFLPVAEECGVIGDLGAWVLAGACRQLARWQAAPGAAPHVSVAVNVSFRQLLLPGFADVVDDAVQSWSVDPQLLELEVAGRVLAGDGPAVDVLRSLRHLGVKIALDGFGVGPSSLAHLRGAPLDRLKIAGPLVHGVGIDESDAAVVRAVVELAHGLGLSTVGQGVETAEQARVLQAVGCDRAQGYQFGAPVSGAELGQRLRGTRV